MSDLPGPSQPGFEGEHLLQPSVRPPNPYPAPGKSGGTEPYATSAPDMGIADWEEELFSRYALDDEEITPIREIPALNTGSPVDLVRSLEDEEYLNIFLDGLAPLLNSIRAEQDGASEALREFLGDVVISANIIHAKGGAEAHRQSTIPSGDAVAIEGETLEDLFAELGKHIK